MSRDAGRGESAPLPEVRLLGPAVLQWPSLEHDETQAQVISSRRGDGPVVVFGAPGTGKTTVLIETVLARVERDGVAPESVLVWAPNRLAATALREQITARAARTLREPLARTPHSYAFGVLRRRHVLDGSPPPRLLSGPEQDRVLADLLTGHESGVGYAPTWPRGIDEQIRGLRAFRGELRDLLMRAVERGLRPSDLARLGKEYDRADWIAASDVYAEYLDVTSLSTPGAYDPAGIIDAAADELAAQPDLLAAERAQWQLIAVDDAQELTTSAMRLLNLLGGQGRDVLLVGDPDVATQAFRGARPRLLVEASRRLRRADASAGTTITLGTVHRHGPALRAVAQRISDRLSSAGMVTHRRPSAIDRPGPAGGGHGVADGSGAAEVDTATVHLLASPAQEAAFAAQLLRRAHLEQGVPWHRMAVLVRSIAGTAALRRALAAAAVPVVVPGNEIPVRDELAVIPLRLAMRCCLDPASLDTDVVIDLLSGPIGGADVLTLRRVRQQLRAADAAQGGSARSDELLLAAVRSAVAQEIRRLTEPESSRSDGTQGTDPELDSDEGVEPGTGRDPIERLARVLAAGQVALAKPGASAHAVLWALWEASGLGPAWQHHALTSGTAGSRADRDLDAVVALFEAAARYTERLPLAGAARFMDYLDGQDLPEDTLADRAPADSAVTLVTATGAAGREWDLVVICGVQERVWPDLRLRSSLLGAQDLADLIDRGLSPERGVAADLAARRAVLDEELRLFLVAVSRARTRLVVTAVSSTDDLPSPFLDLVDPMEADTEPRIAGADEVRAVSEVPRALTLSALIAELRSVLTDATRSRLQRDRAAAHLATLARAGVPGAHPRDWYGAAALSTPTALADPEASVSVSPSQVEKFTTCPLRWLLERSGGVGPSGVSTELGSLIHEIAEDVPDGDELLMREQLDVRFVELGLRPGWVADLERAKAERMITKFAQYTRLARADGRELVAREEAVAAMIGRARVRGRIDRLERNPDGSYVVVDLKTGASKPKEQELARNAQLGVYQAALEADGRVSGGAELIQLGGSTQSVSQQKQPALSQDENPGWVLELLAETADGMTSNTFAAKVNERCRRCPLKRCCPAHPEGRQVTS